VESLGSVCLERGNFCNWGFEAGCRSPNSGYQRKVSLRNFCTVNLNIIKVIKYSHRSTTKHRFSPLNDDLRKWAVSGILDHTKSNGKIDSLPPMFVVFSRTLDFVSWNQDLWMRTENVHASIFHVETTKLNATK